MVTKKMQIARKPIPTSEVIVDGLFGGLLAGLAMLALLMLVSLLQGDLPGAVLARFASETSAASGTPLAGLLRHEAVSGVYGMLFGLLWTPLSRRYPGRPAAVLAGLIYALLLFALAELVILPGTDSPLREVPALTFGAAHLIYGLVLGIFLNGREGE